MAKPGKLSRRISDEEVFETILQLCAATGTDGVVRPEDICIEIYPEDWQAIKKRVRLAVRQLAEAGHLDILRKGEIANPNDFKGVYRVRISPSFFEFDMETAVSEDEADE